MKHFLCTLRHSTLTFQCHKLEFSMCDDMNCCTDNLYQRQKVMFIGIVLTDNTRIKQLMKTVLEGDPVSFDFKSHGYIRWYVVNMFKNTLSDIPFNAHLKSNALFIDHVTSMNEGIYECQGESDEYYEGTYEKIKFAASSILIGIYVINLLILVNTN